jgi:chorismate mutase
MEKPVNQMLAAEEKQFGNEMLDLLKRQRQLFGELQKQSLEQRALIKAQQNEELLSLLARRQKVVDAIGEIHRQSAPYRLRWSEMKDRIPESLRGEISKLLSEVQQMLNLIIEQDQQDCQELSASKQLVAQAMSQTTRAHTANAYYGGPGISRNNPSSGSNFQITG